MGLRQLAAVALAVAVIPVQPARAASIFAPVPGPTGEDITALEWPSAGRLLIGTGGGRIFVRGGDGQYTAATNAATGAPLQTGLPINAIAAGPGASVDVIYAAGQGDNLWVSRDGARSFTRLTGLTRRANCDGSGGVLAAQDFLDVSWAGPDTVYAGTRNQALFRSQAASAADPAFTELNFAAGQQCPLIGADFGFQTIADLEFPIASQPRFAYVATGNTSLYDGALFRTEDGFATRPSRVSGIYGTTASIEVSPRDSGTLWLGGADCSKSTDGGTTWAGVPGCPEHRVTDLVARDTAVLIAGGGGLIVASPNGTRYARQDLDGADATRDWLATAAYDGAHGAVGGRDGVLALTDRLDTFPDRTAPTASIAGPDTAAPGEPVSFSATAADDPDGSGIDPAGYAWSVAGLPAPPSAPTATFTFPQPGTYTVALRVRDLAGNVSDEARRLVTVDARSAPRPVSLFEAGSNPIPKPTTGRDRKGRRIVEIKVRGRLGVPPGVNVAAACRGSLTITITSNRRAITVRKAAVSSRTCRYAKTITVLRSKIKRNRITVTLEFPGNTAVARSTYRKSLRIR